jgi:hypothetical protein
MDYYGQLFFDWAAANDVPFWAILMAICGALVGGMLLFTFAVDLGVALFRALHKWWRK